MKQVDGNEKEQSILKRAASKLSRAGLRLGQPSGENLGVGDERLQSALPLLVKAEAEAQAKRYEAALGLADQALALIPDRAEAWAQRAEYLQSLGRIQEAIASYDRALDLDPSDGRIWFNKATVYINQYYLISAEVLSGPPKGLSPTEVLQAYDIALDCLRHAESNGYQKADAVITVLNGFRQIAVALYGAP